MSFHVHNIHRSLKDCMLLKLFSTATVNHEETKIGKNAQSNKKSRINIKKMEILMAAKKKILGNKENHIRNLFECDVNRCVFCFL